LRSHQHIELNLVVGYRTDYENGGMQKFLPDLFKRPARW
jgi:hypothetical protein